MIHHTLYYYIKPWLPRRVQLMVRGQVARWKRKRYDHLWPVDEGASALPAEWTGWPDGKEFAVVLTHDVDTAAGQDKTWRLAELEGELGLRSSFNFVAERYPVHHDLRRRLVHEGFEIGLHGLTHDQTLFRSRSEFRSQAPRINRYLADWGSVGFRAPCMYHNLDWMHDLNIEYDASTFDTDPFEPQSDGMRTIFPFHVPDPGNGKGYIELPYTLPQDFTLFSLMKEKTVAIWKRKLDWVADKGGMVLVNTHPDYMEFRTSCNGSVGLYPPNLYREILLYLKERYGGRFWHALPREMARHWAGRNTVPRRNYGHENRANHCSAG